MTPSAEGKPPFSITGPHTGRRSFCEPILRALPDWFGIEEAIVEYATRIDELPTFLARMRTSGRFVGFMTVLQHAPESAELYVLGVLQQYHRQGIGRALLESVQSWLVSRHVRFLQVKTLSPSRPDPNYDHTRHFYESVGFTWLEEHKTLWGPANPCLQMVKYLDADPPCR